MKEVYQTATSPMTTGTVSHAETLAGWFIMVKDSKNSHPQNKLLWGLGDVGLVIERIGGGRRAQSMRTDLEPELRRVGPHQPVNAVRRDRPFKPTGTVKLAGVLGGFEQRRCRLEHPRDPRSMGLFRRLVCEALPKIAVENGGPNLKQKVGAPL